MSQARLQALRILRFSLEEQFSALKLKESDLLGELVKLDDEKASLHATLKACVKEENEADREESK